MHINKCAGLAAIALVTSGAMASVVVPGNLVIMQVGDGTTTLTDAGAVVKLRELTPGGGSVQTVTLPSTGSSSLVINGTAVSEGFLTLNDGHIGVAGYLTDAGTASLPGTLSVDVPRRMSGYSLSQDLAGAPAYDASTTALHSGGNIRSAVVSTTVNGFYSVGAGTSSNGINYLANGASGASGTQIAGLNNNRMVDILGGDIYASATPTSRGIYRVVGLPTTSSTAANFVATPQAGNGGARIGLNAFWLSPDLMTAYIADSETSPPSGTPNPGIKKYVFNTSTSLWELAYLVVLGETRYLTVDASGATPILYYVGADLKSLNSIADTGAAFGTPTLLASADANTEFRGVVVTPVPEPGTVGLCLIGGLMTLSRRRRT